METEGEFAPETVRAARDRYATLRPVAEIVVREVARAVKHESDTSERLVTEEVFETAHDALFASLLTVSVGTHDEFEQSRPESATVVMTGSEHVDHVAWHAPPFADRIVATTFLDARDAAVATLRRQAFGRLYRDIFAETTSKNALGTEEGE